MWKLIIVLLLGYFLFRLFMNDMKKRNAEREKEGIKEDEAMAKDPICGVYISEEIGFTVKDTDKIYYFCSDECRQIFLKKIGYESTKNSLDS
ncbi:MAG: transcriptional regulator [Desulfovibrionaceae bacterium]